MPTTYAEQQQKLTEEALKAQQQHSQAYINQMNANSEALAGQYADAANAMRTANGAYENSMAAQAQDIQHQLSQAQQEQKDVGRLESQKSVFGAATEFASALANLWGTTKGAPNQQIRTYSQDWMQRADANRQQRKQRIDNIRERQRVAEQQLAQLKAGNANALAQLMLNGTRDQITRADAAAQLGYSSAMNAVNTQYQGGQAALQAQMHESDKRHQAAMSKQQLDANMLLHGYKPNDNGGYDYDSELAAKMAQDQYTARYGTTGRGSGSGSGNTIPVVIPPGSKVSDDGIVLNISKNALDTAISQHISGITDLTDKEKREVEVQLQNGNTASLYKFIDKSPQLYEILVNASVSSEPYERPAANQNPFVTNTPWNDGATTAGRGLEEFDRSISSTR